MGMKGGGPWMKGCPWMKGLMDEGGRSMGMRGG